MGTRRGLLEGWARWAALLSVLLAPVAHGLDDATVVRVIGLARTQLAATTAAMPSSARSPKAARADGSWSTVANTDRIGWTQGFLPGSQWLMFQVGGEPLWRDRAVRWTRALEGQQTNRETHDLGFKLFTSYGQAYRLTGDPYYRGVLLTAAASLSSRYNATAGIIDCCDWNPRWQLPMVIDTMMNLELLLWAADHGGSAVWRQQALQHALTTLRDAVRPDGSTFHVVDYVPATGAVRLKETLQGAGTNTTWARGQAWAIYGFTMVYRYTRDARMLQAAQRTASWYLDHLPADGIPNWDFDSPVLRKDSSAAAVTASALLELATQVPDAALAARYRAAALRTLDILASPAYLATASTSPGLLRHAVGDLPAGREVDTTLIYADYYFLEALLRFNPRPPYPWYSKTSFSRGTHLLGAGNTGVRQLDFDVIARSAPIDGVVAYADSSTAASSFSSYGMLVRLNPSGFFDVRNGATYGAQVRVPYRSGLRYHVRILADLPARRYSVWVRPPGGSEVRIADRFAFRSDAPLMDDLGQAAVRSVAADSDFRVVGHAVGPAALATAEQLSPAEVDASGCGGEGSGASALGALGLLALGGLRPGRRARSG